MRFHTLHKIEPIRYQLFIVLFSTQYPEAFELAQQAHLANACHEEDEEGDHEGSRRSSNLNKDVSKSTETLRPSISQVFSRSPNEPEAKPEIVDKEKVDTPEKASKIIAFEKVSINNVDDKSKVLEKNKNLKHVAGDKEKRDSSTSSSSENSNACESSGDCTSDTG